MAMLRFRTWFDHSAPCHRQDVDIGPEGDQDWSKHFALLTVTDIA